MEPLVGSEATRVDYVQQIYIRLTRGAHWLRSNTLPTEQGAELENRLLPPHSLFKQSLILCHIHICMYHNWNA